MNDTMYFVQFLHMSFTLVAAEQVIEDSDCDVGVAWSSPCSGGCSHASGENYDGSVGWRFSTEEEWAEKPDKSTLIDEEKCASFIFDDTFTHCDWNNEVVRTNEDKRVEDLWLVCDDYWEMLSESKYHQYSACPSLRRDIDLSYVECHCI